MASFLSPGTLARMSKMIVQRARTATLAAALCLIAVSVQAEPPGKGRSPQAQVGESETRAEGAESLGKGRKGKKGELPVAAQKRGREHAPADQQAREQGKGREHRKDQLAVTTGAQPAEGAAAHEARAEEARAEEAKPGRMRGGRPMAAAAWKKGLSRARAATQGKEGAAEDKQERISRATNHRKELRRYVSGLAGGGAVDKKVSQELRHHAQRTARLARIRALAEAKGDEATIARVDKLVEVELTRHDSKLTRLTGGRVDGETATARADEAVKKEAK